MRCALAALSLTIASLAALPIAGCTSAVEPPDRTSDAFVGPSVSVDSSGPLHVIIVQAPTAGWDVRLDRLLDGPGYTEAFITLREPNPLFVNAQVIAEHRLTSNIASTVECRVFARIRPHAEEDFDGAYAPAASAVARPGPPPSPAPKPAISK